MELTHKNRWASKSSKWSGAMRSEKNYGGWYDCLKRLLMSSEWNRENWWKVIAVCSKLNRHAQMTVFEWGNSERLPYRYCTVRNFCWISNNRSGVAFVSSDNFVEQYRYSNLARNSKWCRKLVPKMTWSTSLIMIKKTIAKKAKAKQSWKTALLASWLVRELISPRIDWPPVGLPANYPVSTAVTRPNLQLPVK